VRWLFVQVFTIFFRVLALAIVITRGILTMSRYLLLIAFILIFIISLLLILNTTMSEADLILTNGVVYTVDAKNSVVEAVAIAGDRIVGVGTSKEIQNKFQSKDVLDLHGEAVYPGFIDAHVHLLGFGVSMMILNLRGTNSIEEIQRMVAQRVKSNKPGRWIRGRGWDQNRWAVKSFPVHQDLDKVAPNTPVYLTRIDGHATWVNKAILELAGITKSTKDPPGGKIMRDKEGNPTGVLIDNAQDLISAVMPPPSEEEVEEAVTRAVTEWPKFGVTSVQDMGVGLKLIELYKKFIDEGKFPIRNYVAAGGESDAWDYYLHHGPEIGYGDNHLTVRSVKLYADGALGSRGAALIEPYTDDPGNRGLTLMSSEQIVAVAESAVVKGFQVCIHAIGDRANTIVLDAYEKAFGGKSGKERRFRVEHAQILSESDIPRFERLGVIPSMQPTHCTSDMYWAEARLGPVRIRRAYAWRSLLNTGVIICGGSDVPVESPNPLLGFYAAITRQDVDGLPRDWNDVQKYFQLSAEGIKDTSAFNGGWYASQKMTREEALKAFTIWAAYGAFEEDLKGSVEVGKLADLVVLSRDIMKIEPREIPDTQVLMTFIGGKPVYEREKPVAFK
jgi:predicted amidohydrolase YtcJ